MAPGSRSRASSTLVPAKQRTAAWPDRVIVQAALAQLPWYHNLALLEKADSRELRLWYARRTVENGWSRNVLVTQIFKDPYLFDFPGTDTPRREAELEQKLIDHIQSFLLEPGQGIAASQARMWQ